MIADWFGLFPGLTGKTTALRLFNVAWVWIIIFPALGGLQLKIKDAHTKE